jgi:tyrosinase
LLFQIPDTWLCVWLATSRIIVIAIITMLSLVFLSIIVLVLNASVSLAARPDGGPRWPSNHGYLRPRQLASTYPVTGIQQSSIQPRLEIRQLQEDFPDTFNIYLLGLQKFQQVDQSDPLSWYGIAGRYPLI